MNPQELEDTIRRFCDRSGLNAKEIVEVLDMLQTGYEMVAQEEEGDD